MSKYSVAFEKKVAVVDTVHLKRIPELVASLAEKPLFRYFSRQNRFLPTNFLCTLSLIPFPTYPFTPTPFQPFPAFSFSSSHYPFPPSLSPLPRTLSRLLFPAFPLLTVDAVS